LGRSCCQGDHGREGCEIGDILHCDDLHKCCRGAYVGAAQVSQGHFNQVDGGVTFS
jgi:hypothetical protein